MTTFYYKRYFEEIRVEATLNWGTCVFYFETNSKGEILRQIERYQNGKILKYSKAFRKDEFGFLGDQPIDHFHFRKFSITNNEFESQWNNL